MAKEKENEVVFDSVETLSRAKSKAESRVKLARALLEDGEIGTADLRKVQTSYEHARAEVNSGLDRLLVELETSDPDKALESYTIIAERAANHVEEFLLSGNALILGDDRSGLIEAGVGVVGTLTTALVDIWKEMRGTKSARNAALIQRIETLKWDQFSDI